MRLAGKTCIVTGAADLDAAHGRIDVVFDNAGVPGVGDVEETTLELWEHVMRVNARGVFLMSKAVVTKGAFLALTKSMQVDPAPHGVRVNALLP